MSAAVGSCFSAAIARRKLRSHSFAKAIIAARATPFPYLGHFVEQIAVTAVPQVRKLPKLLSAAVEHEETAAVEVEREEEQSTKLYFGNLPYHCDSAQLAGIIQEYASPEMVEVLYDRDSGRSRGFAFATMNSLEDCEAVISNLDGTQYGGRTLRVNLSNKPKPKTALYPESEFKLFVGNLPWTVTSDTLTQVFKEHGNLVGARVLYDGETGQSRGYGFVCYSTKEEMVAAMEALNEVVLEGRAMRISLALGKKN